MGRQLIWVRATVHLSGLGLGERAAVDANNPVIAELLEGGFLVSEGPVEG